MSDNELKIITNAKTLIIQNELLKCEILLNKAIKSFPYNYQLLYLRACVYRKFMKFEEALVDLETAYKNLAPVNSLELEIREQIGLTYNEMGMSLFQKNRYSECLTIFTEALKFKENDWGILMNRGDTHLKLHDFKEALSDYMKGRSFVPVKETKNEIDVRIANLYFLLGVDSFNKKEYENAANHFTKSIEFRKDYSYYYLIRGKCFYQICDLHSALNDFEFTLKLDPNNIEAKNYLNLIKKPSFKHLKNVIRKDEELL